MSQTNSQCGCLSCNKYNNGNKCDACLIKIKTMNCDPNNWKNNGAGSAGSAVVSGVDPVRSNIYNGGWLCNFEPQQIENSVLCQRQFFSEQVYPPFNVDCRVNIDSRLKGITVYGNRQCPMPQSYNK